MSPDLLQQITGIATLLTAVAAFLTILEMRQQRTAAYRPALAIEDQPVNLYRPAQADWGHTVVFQSGDKLPSREGFPGGDVRFRVRNVGAGAALEVDARWEFDAVEFATVVARADPKAGQGISVETEFIRFEADGYGSWMARRVQVHHLGTLSASPDAQPAVVPIPFAYALLASAFFQAALSKGIESALRLELPGLALCVSFHDRTGLRLESRYRVTLDFESLSQGGGPIPESPGWSNVGRGIFTVRAA